MFTITVDDGNGGTDTQDVTILVTGSNDAPVITPVDVAGAITEGGTLNDSGSITFADLDLTDRPTATEATSSVTTALTLTPAQQAALENAFTISAAGGNTNNGTINWDYTIAESDLDFLAVGETVTLVFTITVDDGNGGTDTRDVTILVTGSNDAPVITPVDVAGAHHRGQYAERQRLDHLRRPRSHRSPDGDRGHFIGHHRADPDPGTAGRTGKRVHHQCRRR